MHDLQRYHGVLHLFRGQRKKARKQYRPDKFQRRKILNPKIHQAHPLRNQAGQALKRAPTFLRKNLARWPPIHAQMELLLPQTRKIPPRAGKDLKNLQKNLKNSLSNHDKNLSSPMPFRDYPRPKDAYSSPKVYRLRLQDL